MNNDVAIICMSNVQTLDLLQYMHCQKYTPLQKKTSPILMINGLQLLHILMMFNIGQFIYF
jgi:hypothetical protein